MRAKAKYQKDEFLTEINGNPLIEALSFLDKEELLEQLTRVPKFPENFLQAPLYAKEYMLKKLKKAHIPLPNLPDFYSTVTTLILERYSTYHPISAEHRRKQLQLADATINPKRGVELLSCTTAPSTLVGGQSGSGKTTMIRSSLAMQTQVIEHESYKGQLFRQDQLVWVSFDLPSTASKKALALNFFKAVDTALGNTNYYEKWSKRSRQSVDSHLNAMQLIAETHHIGIVHIDEIQFMLKYSQGKDTPSLSSLEALFNKIGVPIILSTTTQGLALFDTANGENQFVDMTTTRRMLSERQFTCKLHKADSLFYRQLFCALFPPQICTENKIPNSKFELQFHKHSCGLPFMMVRLAHLHHETTFRRLHKRQDGATKIKTDDIDSLNKTYDTQFRLIDKALENLRNGNELAFEKQFTRKGGINKFFVEAEGKQGGKLLRKQSAASNTHGNNADLPKSNVAKSVNKKIKLTDDFDDFLTGMED